MSRTATDLSLVFGVLAGVTAIAAAFGAKNFGTALSFGVIAYAIVLIWTMTRD